MSSTNGTSSASHDSPPRDKKGWDGKLRVEKKATLEDQPEGPSPPESENGDAPEESLPTQQIEADEGMTSSEFVWSPVPNLTPLDLLEDVSPDETVRLILSLSAP